MLGEWSYMRGKLVSTSIATHIKQKKGQSPSPPPPPTTSTKKTKGQPNGLSFVRCVRDSTAERKRGEARIPIKFNIKYPRNPTPSRVPCASRDNRQVGFDGHSNAGKLVSTSIATHNKQKKRTIPPTPVPTANNIYKKNKRTTQRIVLCAVRTGLEPVTPCVTGMYSNQLN